MSGDEPRWWWTPARQLSAPWDWPIVFLGSDEFARQTLAARLPGGMLVIPFRRFPGWSGPCVRCGQWEPDAEWAETRPNCSSCHRELVDYDNGCICPSFTDDRFTVDDPWPLPECEVHAHLLAPSTPARDEPDGGR